MRLAGIRGAITVKENTKEEIIKATGILLKRMIKENGIEEDDIVSILFSVTDDLNAEFPARAARQELGFIDTPLMCFKEIDVPGSLSQCIRILIFAYSNLKKSEVKHIYLGQAKNLRPDLFVESNFPEPKKKV